MNELKAAIQQLAGTFNKDPVSIIVCTVDSIDIDTRTCTCKAITGDATTEISGVQLMTEVSDGFLLLPLIGSTVIVGISVRNVAFIILFSEVDKIIMRGGDLGGVPITPDLVTRFNNIENDINDLKEIFSTAWTPVPNDGGAALKAAAASWSALTLIPTEDEDIENENITQG